LSLYHFRECVTNLLGVLRLLRYFVYLQVVSHILFLSAFSDHYSYQWLTYTNNCSFCFAVLILAARIKIFYQLLGSLLPFVTTQISQGHVMHDFGVTPWESMNSQPAESQLKRKVTQ
jgi:hypothetical protein